MPKCVHTKMLNSGFVTQLVKVGIIGTVLRWLSRAPVDKDEIVHDKLCGRSGSAVNVFQRL